MKAVIGIEDGEVVARLYLDGIDMAHINYGKVANVKKAYVEKCLAAMKHEVVEPWDIVKEVQHDVS